MNKNFKILTGPVQSGKSAALFNWCLSKKNIAGFLNIDKRGLRYLYDISKQDFHAFQIAERANVKDIAVGKYIFAWQGFENAKKIVDDTLPINLDWIIIDEIGKLEMQDQGFEPELSNWIKTWSAKQQKTILVVRDSLLESVILKYHLQGCEILNINQIYELG